MTYRLGQNNEVINEEGATLPCRFVDGVIQADDWHSPFVLTFASWVGEGNTPAPADPAPEAAPELTVDDLAAALVRKGVLAQGDVEVAAAAEMAAKR